MGKTNIVESIYLLSNATSFRTAHFKEMIANEKDEAIIEGEVTYKQRSNKFKLDLKKTGKMEAQLKAEELTVSLLTEASNIQVYGFADRTEITTNLDNYMDVLHYGDWINEEIMNMIYERDGELTKENYKEYFQRVREIYSGR